MNYNKLTIHEKINFKDYLKSYCIAISKSGYAILKQDINDHAIKYAKNSYSNNIKTILEIDSFIQNYGIFQPYMNK